MMILEDLFNDETVKEYYSNINDFNNKHINDIQDADVLNYCHLGNYVFNKYYLDDLESIGLNLKFREHCKDDFEYFNKCGVKIYEFIKSNKLLNFINDLEQMFDEFEDYGNLESN